jgi:Secretion system C-terminal sorting domain
MNKITFLFFLLVHSEFEAQTWQRLIENPFNFGGAQAYGIRVIDDTIYVSSVFVVTDTIANNRAVISKHSLEDGVLLEASQFWDNTHQNSMFNSLYSGYNQLYDTNDTLLYMSITPFNYDELPSTDTRILTINKNLEVITEQTVLGFEGDLVQNMNGTRIDVSGNIILYGARSRLGNYYEPDSANTWLVKITPQGEQLWSKRFDDTQIINFLAPLTDGDIIFNCGWSAPTIQDEKRVIKTNSSGEEQWRMTFGGTYSSSKSAIVETNEDKIILANSWNYFYVDEPGTDWWYRTWLQFQKINDLGDTYNIETDVKYVATRNVLDAYGIEEMTNGNLLTWGIVQSTAGDTYDTANQIWTKPVERGFLMMLNSDLDSLWFRTYYHPDDDILQMHSEYLISDVAPLEDGGFVTCGWGDIRDLGNLQQVWLMRLDEYGCLEPGCQNVNVTEIVLGFENSMTLFPNPVHDMCTIQWNLENISALQNNFSNTELVVTDSQGREVKRLPISNFGNHHKIQIDVTDFSAGIYQAHWVSGSSWLDTVQIVKE